MKKWTVYILRCADNTLYTGITIDVQQRIAKHNLGTGAKYTRSRRPVILAWSKKSPTESHARKNEIRIKKMTRPEKIKLISTLKNTRQRLTEPKVFKPSITTRAARSQVQKET